MNFYKKLARDSIWAEFEIHRYLYNKVGLDGEALFYFPLFYQKFTAINQNLLNIIFYILFQIWPLGLILINFYLLVQYCFKKVIFFTQRDRSFPKTETHNFSEIYFASSSLAVDLFRKVNNKPCIILHRPNKRRYNIIVSMKIMILWRFCRLLK